MAAPGRRGESGAKGQSTRTGGRKVPGVKFPVFDVPVAEKALREVPAKRAVEGLVGARVEACSDYRGTLVASTFHPLVGATWSAFDEHRPLVLSPDIIWLTIAQGVATHVRENAEALRHAFTTDSGNEPLHVVRDDFVKGSPENPWGEVIGEFSRQIGERIGDWHGRLVSDFSTTGPAERVASEVVLMGAMQSYFEYRFHSKCGIPSVTLEGEVRDWEAVRARVDSFDALGLSWWTGMLRPILDQFVLAAKREPDGQFWRSIFKEKGASGGPYLTGWLVRFFPYLEDDEYEPRPSFERTGRKVFTRNPYLEDGADDRFFGGVTADRLPSSLARAPFHWKCLGKDLNYEFIAGLVGIEQDVETMAVRPKVGWAVRAV